jgi:hypothetical protein
MLFFGFVGCVLGYKIFVSFFDGGVRVTRQLCWYRLHGNVTWKFFTQDCAPSKLGEALRGAQASGIGIDRAITTINAN